MHFHTLFLDGAYVLDASGDPPRWQTLHPCDEDVREVVEAVRRRADALLSRRRQPPLLDEDRNLARVCQLCLLDERIDGPPSPRPRPARNGNPLPRKHMGARAGQWDLHAAVTVAQGKRDELLRLCKYIVRSPLALQRMELLPDGRIRYALRRPRLDGGTCIELEPVDLVARLTAMIPPRGRHMVRYHGVLAPAAPQRALVVPRPADPACPKRRRATTPMRSPGPDDRIPWAELLRRTFSIDVLRCARCGGQRSIVGIVRSGSAARTRASLMGHVSTTCTRVSVALAPRHPEEQAHGGPYRQPALRAAVRDLAPAWT